MSDFYEQMGQMARELLAPTSAGGLGQGRLELVRSVNIPPDNPWDPPIPKQQVESIDGAVRGVDSRLVGVEVGGTVILASDRVAITEVPKMGYEAGDVLTVDGRPVNIIAVEKIPAAGITSAVRFIIRG